MKQQSNTLLIKKKDEKNFWTPGGFELTDSQVRRLAKRKPKR